MPHWLILPATPVVLISWRKDQCRWWTPLPPLPPSASPLFAFFPLYMSQYLEDLRRGELRVCVCIVEVLPGDSIPCWWCVWCGVGGLKRRSRHLPDCWNVNAVALIIGFCTHRLWGTSSNFPPLIVRPSPGPSIGLGCVYTSTHVSIKTVYNVCVRVRVCVVLDFWITAQLCVTGRLKMKARLCQIIKIWQIFKILRDLSGLKVGFFQILGVLQ